MTSSSSGNGDRCASRGLGCGEPPLGRGAVPRARLQRQGLRDLHARPERARRRPGTPAPSASRATPPRRSSASTSRSSTPPEDTRRASPSASSTRPRREGRFEEEGWRVRKDGTRFWADVVITAVRRRAPASSSASPRSPATSPSVSSAQEERAPALAHAQEAIRLRDEFLSIAVARAAHAAERRCSCSSSGCSSDPRGWTLAPGRRWSGPAGAVSGWSPSWTR